jgi:hypothetical protein
LIQRFIPIILREENFCDVGLDEKLILKLALKRLCPRMGTGFIRPRV